MRIHYDEKADALHWRLADGEIVFFPEEAGSWTDG